MEQPGIRTARVDGFTAHGANNADDMAMQIHDISMSADPLIAAIGRAGKKVVLPLDAWISEEKARGTSPEVVLNAIMSTVSTITVNTLLCILGPAGVKACGPALAELFCDSINRAVESGPLVFKEETAEQEAAMGLNRSNG